MITIATWPELRTAIEKHPATDVLRTHLEGLEEFEDQPLNELCEFIFAEPTDSIHDLERKLGRALHPPPWEYADQTDGWYELVLVTSDFGSGYVVLVDLQSIATEFEALAKRGIGGESARALLKAYIAMLRRHILTDEELDAVAARIWDQHREALEFLMDRQPDSGDALTASLYDNLEDIAARMSEHSGLTIVPDDSSANLQRFAVTEWDALDDFLTAQNWTSSKRIILLEIQRSGTNRETLRMRFVLGPGSPEVRQRYFRELEEAGVPTTTRREITGQFTRLASIQLARNLSGDKEAAMQTVLSHIDRYAREEVKAYDRALRG